MDTPASAVCTSVPSSTWKRQDGVSKMASIANAVSDLVLEFGGSMSGEHGDGRARSVWNEKMFGSQIYDAFPASQEGLRPGGHYEPRQHRRIPTDDGESQDWSRLTGRWK